MTTFLLFLSLFLFFVFKRTPGKDGIKKYIIAISAVLIFVSTFRHEGVGNDTFVYIQFFDSMSSRTWSEFLSSFLSNYLNPSEGANKDPGFNLFIKFCYDLVPNARFFLFIVASLLIITLGVFVYRHSTKITTTLFFYIFYICTLYNYLPNSAIRQSMAVTLVLVAYMVLEKNKYIYFLLFVLLGSFFHKSCLLALLILPPLFFNEKMFYKFGVLLLLFGLLFTDQMALLFMDQSEVYDAYLTNQYYGGSNGNRPVIVILLFLVLYVVGWMGLPYVRKDFTNKLLLVGTAFTLVFVPLVWVNPSLLRTIAYFAPFMGIFVGDSLNKIKIGFWLRIIIIVVFVVNSLSSINSYRFMWQNMKLHDRYAMSHTHDKDNHDNSIYTIDFDFEQINKA